MYAASLKAVFPWVSPSRIKIEGFIVSDVANNLA